MLQVWTPWSQKFKTVGKIKIKGNENQKEQILQQAHHATWNLMVKSIVFLRLKLLLDMDSFSWCLDSGATENLVNNEKLLSDMSPLPMSVKIEVAKSGQVLRAKYSDEAKVLISNQGETKSITLKMSFSLVEMDYERSAI